MNIDVMIGAFSVVAIVLFIVTIVEWFYIIRIGKMLNKIEKQHGEGINDLQSIMERNMNDIYNDIERFKDFEFKDILKDFKLEFISLIDSRVDKLENKLTKI